MNNSRHRFILSLLTAFTALTVTDPAWQLVCRRGWW